MHRAIPQGSKLLSKKWAQQEQEIHKKKLRDIRPTVEIREPPKFKHLKKKLKKTQMLEGKGEGDGGPTRKEPEAYQVADRYTEIERENRILLEKMTNIM